MNDVDIAVLCGISTRVIDPMTKALRANAIEPVFTKVSVDTGSYLESLLANTCATIKALDCDQKIRIRSLTVISGFSKDEDIALEARFFFPAARRFAVKPEYRNNPASSAAVRDAIIRLFKNKNEVDSRKEIRGDIRNLLPLRNCGCKGITDSVSAIYLRDTNLIDRKVDKEICRVKGSKALRIRGIDFLPANNNDRHPIRRCSDSLGCDLAASFRLGVPVNERFEFDVTCRTGLKGKTFYQCSGSANDLTHEPSHLNMRINDDHAVG
jgi:hypothetical protein